MLASDRSISTPQPGRAIFALCLLTGAATFSLVALGVWMLLDAPLPGNTLFESEVSDFLSSAPQISLIYLPALALCILWTSVTVLVGSLQMLLRRVERRFVGYGVAFGALSLAATVAMFAYIFGAGFYP